MSKRRYLDVKSTFSAGWVTEKIKLRKLNVNYIKIDHAVTDIETHKNGVKFLKESLIFCIWN